MKHIRYKLFKKEEYKFINELNTSFVFNKNNNNKGGNMHYWKNDYTVYYTASDAFIQTFRHFNISDDIVICKVECSGNLTRKQNNCQVTSKLKIIEVYEDLSLKGNILDYNFTNIFALLFLAQKYPDTKNYIRANVLASDALKWIEKYPQDKEYFLNNINFTNRFSLALFWCRKFPEDTLFIANQLKNNSYIH